MISCVAFSLCGHVFTIVQRTVRGYGQEGKQPSVSQFDVGASDSLHAPRALPVCPYDASGCTRKNPAHFSEFSHPTADRQRLLDQQLLQAAVGA